MLFQIISPSEEIKDVVEATPPELKNEVLLAVIVPLFVIVQPFAVVIDPFRIRFPVEEIVNLPDVDIITLPLKVKALFKVVL